MKKYARGTSDAAAWNIKLSEGEDMKGKGHQVHLRALSGFRRALVLGIVAAFAAAGTLQAQVPPAVAAELVKMGRVVDPGCTAKLYRPLFGKNDYNTYWPVDAAAPNKNVKLYPGVTVFRDVSYGPQPKDLIDIFVPEKGGANRTIFMFVPGGGGNKIEQQSVEANMFYDNIGKWAAENGMVGVTIQRGGTAAGQNIALVVEYLQTNAARYKGNGNDMFIMAHSAGTGPLTQYIGRPDLYGLGVKGAIFMGAHPNIGGGGRGGPGAGGRGGAPAGAAPGGGRGPAGANNAPTCTAGANAQAGAIRGPSSVLPDQGMGAAKQRQDLAGSSPWRWDGKVWISTGALPPAAAEGVGGRGGGAVGAPGGGGGGRGAGAGGRGDAAGAGPQGAGAPGAELSAPTFTVQDGFHSTRAAIALAWGELDIDPETGSGMPSRSVAIHDELCKLDGPKAKDGVGHCPTMMWFKGESHMSEVFSIGSIDRTVSDQIMAFIKKNK
jgi:hypothetical protein